MSRNIHPTAIISNKAELGENVSVGAFSIIEDDVVIGDNTEIHSSVVIARGTTIGKECRIFPSVVIGTEPQDLKYANEPTKVILGDRNVIREFVSIHRGTHLTGRTLVGSDNLIMAYCHIAHDCTVGSNNIMSNTTQFAGHVTAEDNITFGAFAKVHQFCSVGCHAMVGSDIKAVKDIPPYVLIGKIPPKVEGLNKIGLRRRGFSVDVINELEEFYKILMFSGLNTSDGIAAFKEKHESYSAEIVHCIEFIEKSKRGIYR